jgi:RNA-directed DNA polymerase
MLANLYLSEFDKAVTKRGLQLVRYADDFVIMCKTEEEATSALEFCRDFLLRRLGLSLNEKKTGIVYNGGFDFLGFRIEPGSYFPSEKSIKRLESKISNLVNPKSGSSLLPLLMKLKNMLVGWHEAYRRSDLKDVPSRINNHVVATVSNYLSENRFLPPGTNLSNRQLKILGIPRLTA